MAYFVLELLYYMGALLTVANYFQSMRFNADNKMETAAAAKKVGLLKPQQRNALGDIGNNLNRAKAASKKARPYSCLQP